MRIAACDDDKRQLERLMACFEAYKAKDGESLSVDYFSSGLELLTRLDKTAYDALFLDILMPGLSGMDVAHDVRRHNDSVRIVFLTSSPEFAVESYRVKAFDYLLKPVDQKNLNDVLERLFRELSSSGEMLRITTAKSILSIPFSKIEYLEINNRTLNFHMAGGEIKEITGRLYEVEDEIVSHPEFKKIHRSFIVNFKYVRVLDIHELQMLSGDRLPMSRSLAKQVKDDYVNYLHDSVHI